MKLMKLPQVSLISHGHISCALLVHMSALHRGGARHKFKGGGGCTFIVFVGIQIYIVNSIDDKGLQNFPGCGYTQSSQRSSALALPDGAISFSSTN
jgi:hypothetical protein